MNLKKLKLNGQVFVPQTVAEGVLVKDNGEVTTLDVLLEKKIETIITPNTSGLNSYNQGKSIIITHANTITPNSKPEAIKVLYNNTGHIINTSPLEVSVNKILYESNDETFIKLGDDFKIDENKNINLTWGNGTT